MAEAGRLGEAFAMLKPIVVITMIACAAACGTDRAASETHAAAAQPMSSASTDPTAGPGASCGTVRSAAGVPGTVTVRRGYVDCARIRRILAQYYADLATGRAPGMGGGGPVALMGWTCASGPVTAPGTSCTTTGAEVTVGLK